MSSTDEFNWFAILFFTLAACSENLDLNCNVSLISWIFVLLTNVINSSAGQQTGEFSWTMRKFLISNQRKYHQWYQNITLWHSTLWQTWQKLLTVQKSLKTTNRACVCCDNQWKHLMFKNWRKVMCHKFLSWTSLVVFRLVLH